jgi:glycosyltransferase involved in cell wall biosynthesis
MRIAQVAPLYESVPPLQYGGTERVVSHLTEELVRLGHEVTLFASGDSETSARLIPACERSLWNDPKCRDYMAHHIRLIGLVFEDVSRFDIIHFHADYLHYPLLRHLSCRTVTTLHGCIFPHDVRGLYEQFPETPLISISDEQRRPLPNANWQATVYHGVPRGLYRFNEGGDYLAFLGRVSPEKRIDRAVEIAARVGMKLKVAARIDPTDEDYYHEQIEPLFRKHKSFVEFVGQIGDREKEDFLGGAAAMLFPIDWPEPFGLVMVESLACGTPVIGWRNGSVPEVIDEGRTGFVVGSIEDAVAAVEKIGELDRATCRRVFEERFDVMRMARDYLDAYARLRPATAELSRSGYANSAVAPPDLTPAAAMGVV